MGLGVTLAVEDVGAAAGEEARVLESGMPRDGPVDGSLDAGGPAVQAAAEARGIVLARRPRVWRLVRGIRGSEVVRRTPARLVAARTAPWKCAVGSAVSGRCVRWSFGVSAGLSITR